ncbi:hypothetical protein [Serratia proteamaculans]|uniref:hypothetical protein n=1 Tax=Serratia proteamaculans TaxID=28151 RepID=UPI003D069B2B
MKIDLPDIASQQRAVFESGTRYAIEQLQKNLNAPRLPAQSIVDENLYPRTHLVREREGWEAPHKDIVDAYFRHFQEHFPEYKTDRKLAELLGLSSDRRVRTFKDGSVKVPYGVWRHFLVLTGRVPQEAIPVMAFMG